MGRYFSLIRAIALAGCVAGCAARTGIENFPRSSDDINFRKIERHHSDRARNPTFKFEYAFPVRDTAIDEIHSRLLIALRHEGYSVVVDDPVGNTILGIRAWTHDVRSIAGVYFRKIHENYHIYVKIELDQEVPDGWRSDRAKEICMAICNQIQSSQQHQ